MKVQCLNCKKYFDKKSWEIARSKHHYCSRNCSAVHHNTFVRKNPPKERNCKLCSTTFFCNNKHRSRTVCSFCTEKNKNARLARKKYYQSLTLADYYNAPSIKDKHPSWRNSHIRTLNRSWNHKLTKLPCQNCNYKKHVELCHIKAISSFPPETKVSEINHPKNIIVLCRNCHWELDHKILNIVDIRQRNGSPAETCTQTENLEDSCSI